MSGVKEKLSLGRQIAFSVGQLGWATLSGIVSSYLVYFYSPPSNSGIPVFIPQGTILGIFTVIGLITMSGRLLDAVTDPWIATLSDRHNSPKGRRIPFLKFSALPFVILTILIFFPPVFSLSALNVLWLTVTLLLFYIFFTFYVTPYFALISEIGNTPNERLNISTYISVTFFIGTALASQATSIWNAVQKAAIEKYYSISVSDFALFSKQTGNIFSKEELKNYILSNFSSASEGSSGFLYSLTEKVNSIQFTFIILSVFSLICLLIPVIFIDEKRYCHSKPSEIKMFKALKEAFSKKEFLVFTISDLAYFLALTVMQTGLIFYITVLLELPESMYSVLFIVLGVLSFLFYPFVNFAARKIGKKKLMIIAFFIFTVMYSLIFFMGKYFSFIPDYFQAYAIVILASLPMAIFGILPNAIIADIAEHDAVTTGNRKEAIFFGARTFMSKMGQMLASLIFTYLLTFGKDVGNDLGIRLTGPIAAIFCFFGLIFFLMYDEKNILSIYKEKTEN
ncbi:MAG: MFS transporter [Thermotogae bacterium]|nr:MFS transporter [Thermotogota bacterium]